MILAVGCNSNKDAGTSADETPPTVPPSAAGPTEIAIVETPTAVAVVEEPTSVASQPLAQSAIATSLTQTAAITSGRMEGSMVMTGLPGMPVDTEFSVPFSGEFDNAAGVFAFRMDLSGIAEATGEELPPGFDDLFGEMEMRTFGNVAYMKFPLFSAFLGAETDWIKIEAEDAASAAGGFSGGISPGNPTEALQVYKDANAQIVELGRETIRGVETNHYLVVIDMQALFETLPPEELAELEAQGPLPFDELPMQLWIADDGLIYRYSMEISGDSLATVPGQSFGTMTMTFDMFDYGAQILIEEPPASEVTDASELGGLFEF